LRREEVAQLAGISHTWYTNIEQGREVRPSSAVIDALARALRLDPDARDHLRRLAGLSVHPRPTDARADPVVRAFVEAIDPLPASVVTSLFDYVAVNSAYTRLYGIALDDLPADRRNTLFAMFDTTREFPVDDISGLRTSLVEQLRFQSAEDPSEPRLTSLITELMTESEEFRQLWAHHENVRRSTEEEFVLTWHHRLVGDVHLRPTQLSLLARPNLWITVHIPLSPTDRQRLQSLHDMADDSA
jgi:transcriptional regulator with XRE-family HTH domain